MKIELNNITEVSLDQIKESISFKEILELVESVSYHDNFKEDMIEAIGLNSQDHFDHICDYSMNQHIKDNLEYYEATSDLVEEKKLLTETLLEAKEEEIKVPENPHDAKRYFCDLLDMGYHVKGDEILNKIFLAISTNDEYDNYENKVIGKYLNSLHEIELQTA